MVNKTERLDHVGPGDVFEASTEECAQDLDTLIGVHLVVLSARFADAQHPKTNGIIIRYWNGVDGYRETYADAFRYWYRRDALHRVAPLKGRDD